MYNDESASWRYGAVVTAQSGNDCKKKSWVFFQEKA